MIRGLFGSSARQAAPLASELQGLQAQPEPAPLLNTPAPAAGPAAREYLGGLVKYEPQQGMSGGERMQLIGATLRDVGSSLNGGQGGNLEAVQEGFRARQAKTQKEAVMQRVRDMAKSLYGDNEEARLLFEADPGAFVESRLKALEPDNQFFEGPDGLYQVDKRSGTSKKVQSFERTAQPGWQWNGDKLEPIPGGAYDPEYIRQAAGVRRDVVIDNPTPSRARAGGGGSGGGGSGGSAGGSRRQPWAD